MPSTLLKRLSHKLGLQYGAHDLYPVHQIESQSHLLGPHAYHAHGDDPHFRFRMKIKPGWYMAEVRLTHPNGRVNARFYLDTGEGESEQGACGLPLVSGKLCKRLIHVTASAQLRFDPCDHPGPFVIGHFRLVRMPKFRALERLHKKLTHYHPRYQTSPIATTIEQCWQDYNQLFESRTGHAVSYAQWIDAVETPRLPTVAAQQDVISGWKWTPKFSVLLPVFNTPETLLRECLDSVLEQTYPNWELCIADDASTLPHVRRILSDYARRDTRVRLTLRQRNGHISQASNSALHTASGEFVALLDHDDTLAPHALFAIASALQSRPSAEILYSDEDKLDELGQRCDPYFKPGWSPDLLHSQNYISHLGVYRRELVLAAGGFTVGLEGSQDYDLLLRCVEKVEDTADIVHIPQVLYHWRKTEGSTALSHGEKSYANLSAQRALQDHMNRRYPGVQVEIRAPGLYRAQWPLPTDLPLVSLIIPTRDGYEILKTCIDSILSKTSYPNYEVLLVDNQSSCEMTLAYMDSLVHGPEGQGRVRLLRHDQPFNYSAINNYAASQANGSLLGLINNDIEVISPDWLTEMVRHAVRPDIGCVGAKLLYPDDTIQHAGIVLGIGGVAGHSHKYMPASSDGYFSRLRITHNVSAVTGACLLLRKEVFDAVGGLDAEQLTVAFNDVDLCLKVREKGYRNLLTPDALLYHHESVSRGADISPEKRARFESEVKTMKERWGTQLATDPYYNPNLSLVREDYSLNMEFSRHEAVSDYA